MTSPQRYELLYTRRALRDVDCLDPVARKRLARRLEALRLDPLGLSQKLVNSKIGQYRCRFGDYRVVFDLHGRGIVVLRVGHRREIYR
ncbi:MAG: type II toxin-antitoxin system RelE/ParE family toxin [Elusimicrobia bacterium]|nr:type II toxin-antitoxin system RelE/ParE family toxin [Elusimicrobiota bacterium]